jgi:hypothetical protein
MTAAIYPKARHRKRRFHIRPEALGHGFAAYDVPTPPEPAPTAPPSRLDVVSIAQTEILSQKELAWDQARTVFRVGSWILLGVFLFLPLSRSVLSMLWRIAMDTM